MKKAAFLLIAAAWLTGSAHGHGRSNSCCTPAPSCDPCCEKPGLLDRLRARFHRDDCCQPTCEVRCAPVCQPTCAPACNSGHGRKLFHRSDCCQPTCAPTCAPSCDDHCRPSLFERLKARFHRDRCNDCCDPCGGTVIGGAPVKGGEVITTPPKKLPPAGSGGGKTGEPLPGEVRIITPPATAPVTAPPAIHTIPAAPGLETRSPF